MEHGEAASPSRSDTTGHPAGAFEVTITPVAPQTMDHDDTSSPSRSDLDLTGHPAGAPELITTLAYGGTKYTLRVLPHEVLVEGGFGFVYQGEMVDDKDKRLLVAVKIITCVDALHERLLASEIETWKKLDHANIQPYYGTTSNLGIRQVGIVSPLAAGGNLLRFIRKKPTSDRLGLLLQVAKGLEYLHLEAKIVHGDLKCVNVLITEPEQAKIWNFELSTAIESEREDADSTLMRLITVAFAAPELLSDQVSKTTQSDAFAFGRLIYEAYAAQGPWNETDPQEIRSMVLRGIQPPRKVENEKAVPLSNALWNLCTACWDKRPSKRPNCGQIKDTLESIRQAESASGQSQAVPSPGRSTGTSGSRKLKRFLNVFRS